MSVLKNKRSLSNLEYYHNAITLRKDITFLLLRDFGVKDKIRKTSSLTKEMTPEDTIVFQNLINKYECTNVLEEFPVWLIDKMRNNIMNILYLLIMNISQAFSINPTNLNEFQERRNFQNRAIGNCEQLLQEMQYIISIIPVDANKYIPYVENIQKEIFLLKRWRKSDNKLLKNLK